MAGQTRGLIFDFDGTIADSLQPIFAAVNRLSTELGYRRIPDEDKDRLREKSARDLLRQIGIPLWRLPVVANRMREEMNRQMSTISPIAGIAPVLRELRGACATLGILTSNSGDNVAAFLRQHDLDVFDFIASGSSLFGKTRLLRRVLKSRGLRARDFCYVGDESRDIDAARKVPIPVIAVTWGFNSEAKLRSHSPDHLVAHPPELVEVWRRRAGETTAR